MQPDVKATISDLLHMNKDALAALVRLGADAGDPRKFITDETDRWTVAKLLNQNAVEPRTAAGSLD